VQLTAELFPEISPDGTLITWVHFLNDGEIGVANRDGTNPTRLTNSPGNDEQPTFRPCP
jgi:Tol biopolymer transport system component